MVVESEHLVGAEPRVLEDMERHRDPLSVPTEGDQAFLSPVDHPEHDESPGETVSLGEIIRRMAFDRREEIGRRVDTSSCPLSLTLVWFSVLYLT